MYTDREIKEFIQSLSDKQKEELKDSFAEEEKLNIKEMHYKEGQMDLSLSDEYAMTFMKCLVDFFKANGGKNFLTIDVMDKKDKYSITIQNCNGIDTPTKKLTRLENAITEIETYLEESIKEIEKIIVTEKSSYLLIGKVVHEETLKTVKAIKAKYQID